MGDSTAEAEERRGQSFVTSFARRLSVLEAFGPGRRRMTLADAAAAAKPDGELELLLRNATIAARTEKTVTDRGRILQLIRKSREAGYACNDEELELGLFGLSVPVRNRGGRVVASLNANSQARRITAK